MAFITPLRIFTVALFAWASGGHAQSAPTTIDVGFTDPTTIQLRITLGGIDHAVLTEDVPPYSDLDQGWLWRDGWSGRVQLSGEAFMPLDRYTPSPLDPLFDAPGGDTADRRAAVDDPSRWSVTVGGQHVGLVNLSRKSNILDTAQIGWGDYAFRSSHSIFLHLDTTMRENDNVAIRFDDPAFPAITQAYAPAQTRSEALHVNLTGYHPEDTRKIAYLSSWNGWSHTTQTAVAQTYEAPLPFDLHDAATGEIVFSGNTTLGTPAAQTSDFDRNYALTEVWELDFSDLSRPGTYYIAVSGVGRSSDFAVQPDVWDIVFQTSASGFYHQRSGIALEAAYTDWTRARALHPDDGRVVVYATTLPITDTDESYGDGKHDQFAPLVAAATDDILQEAWGGWHDAGDWDRRTQHLSAARKLMDLVEIAPDWAAATHLRIPESTNALPDVLDEALWGLAFFARLQADDGGVRGGIEGDSYRGYGANSAEEVHTLYAYAPDTWTTWEFAASAAKLSRVIAPYDAEAAEIWLERATRAMLWAEARVPQEIDITQATSRNLAAAELYATTGDATWHDLYLQTSNYRVEGLDLAWNEYQYEAAITYARLPPDQVKPHVAARGLASLESQADFLLTQGSTGGFGYLADPYAPYGWGNTASQPFNAAKFMVPLHHLTGDQRHLDAILGDVQYGLGANPLNMVYLTGFEGLRSPEIVLNADADSMGGRPPPGITLYADYNIFDYGQHFAHDVMWNAMYPGPYDAPVHESFQGYYTFVPSTEYTVQQGIADMTYVTGYLAAQAALTATSR